MDQAHSVARANLNKDHSFRRWGSSHGGVYVPITPTQQSVPWLSHVPGRNVVTTEGKALTLLNPASMLRQVMDSYAEEFGVRGRITGLKYLNPGNQPDEWERKQLKRFEQGEVDEVWSVTDIDGKPYLRHLQAMYMEKGCEKCHGILGYKEGDMRGASGLNLPLENYYQQIDDTQYNISFSHGLIWVLGLLGITWGGHVRYQRYLERQRREQERTEAAKTLQTYKNAFDSSGEAMLLSDRENRIFNVNVAFTKLTGYSLEDIKGQNPNILASKRTPDITYQELWSGLNEEDFWQGELWNRSKSGDIYPKWVAISTIRNDFGEVMYYMASFTDISERKAAEARIEHLAHHDVLTGLPNRFSFEIRLEQAILTAHREQKLLALFFIDLDKFKYINDTLGHHFGDKLLVTIAQRLNNCVRENDIVARIGGDEFVVVLTGLDHPEHAGSIAEKLCTEISRPCDIDGHDIQSTTSIGVSIYPNDALSVEALMKNADVAMYHAKDSGRNNFQFFSNEMLIVIQKRLQFEHDIEQAIHKGEFELHYQPQVTAKEGAIFGVEALIRWNHPQRGLVAPTSFIIVAEETGKIHQIGDWVINEACHQLAQWKQRGINIQVSINLSAMQLQSNTLLNTVKVAMQHHSIEQDELEFEITETSAMQEPELALRQLHELRQLGVKLAIDDFGTGYSSLAYIKRLPVQILKLDRTFVRDISSDENDAEISAATITLAHNLGLKVVAEGVETEAQRDFLLSYHCDYLQGYLFSKPLPAAEITALLMSEQLEEA